MFSVGHLAFGYLSGRASSRLLNVDVNIPLLFLASILADIDLLIPGLEHRGPTHSLIVFCAVFLPFLITFKKKAIPHFIASAQHFLLGDYLTGGVQMLWPINTNWYGLRIKITSPINILTEWTFFLACLTIMLKTRDAWTLFKQHPSNLLLSIPVFTVLLPTFFSFPMPVPYGLIIPHLMYLTLFTLSILIDFKIIIKKT